MKHFLHKHSLILNENYVAREDDVCFGCKEQIVSCKSFIYSCTLMTGSTTTDTRILDKKCVNFLLHKSCAEMPPTIENPFDKEQSLVLSGTVFYWTRHFKKGMCNICGKSWVYISPITYISFDRNIIVCVQCAVFQVQSQEDRRFHHPAHNQHTLTLIQQPSSFKCYACRIENDIKDLSYICTKCPFWIHKSCADAPASFSFHFHDKHPLILSFDLPQVYRKFDQHCRLCKKTLYQSLWLYYCPGCRFFVHFHCARSSRLIMSSSENEIYSDVVHLPAADESSATNILVEQYLKAMSTTNYDSILTEMSTTKHRAHCEHHLQLMTFKDLNDQKDDDGDIILLCDGCVKPIRSDGNQFYGCVSCKYFLHRDCAKLPHKIKPNFWPDITFFADKYSEPFMCFSCAACGGLGNGIFFRCASIKLHIGCTILPKNIKHEAHLHQLDLMVEMFLLRECDACGQNSTYNDLAMYKCKTCNVHICAKCLMMAGRAKHPWDPHSLDLIYEAGMVTEHEDEFDCEYCSEEINTNRWFYHCSHCDLSFHLECLRKSSYNFYSNIKFGATNIVIHKLHPHGLSFVLNKKHRRCEICLVQQLGEPILECAQCKVIFCRYCSEASEASEDSEDSEEK